MYSLDDILSSSVNGSGYNAEYGLLGSNKSTADQVKLFPRDCQPVVETIQQMLTNKTGKQVEVMVYGDGAFKDPIGKYGNWPIQSFRQHLRQGLMAPLMKRN